MIVVKQSTARIVTVGPILDADGVAVTDSVIGDLKISKNGGTPTALNGSATLTHSATGHYSLLLTTSDLNTVGSVEIISDDTVNAMAVKELVVVEEAVYDALFAASAPGYLQPTTAGRKVNVDVSGYVNANVMGDPNDLIQSLIQMNTRVIGPNTIGSTGNDSTHIHAPTWAFGDDEINDLLLLINDTPSSEVHVRWIEDWVNSTKLITVAALPFTPSGGNGYVSILPVRRDVDAVKVNGSKSAATLIAALYDALETLTVDDTHFTPTTTQAQFTAAIDLEKEYLYQGLIGLTGANAGVTIWCTAYTYDSGNSQVKLTFDALQAAPANGDTFAKIGRRRST